MREDKKSRECSDIENHEIANIEHDSKTVEYLEWLNSHVAMAIEVMMCEGEISLGRYGRYINYVVAMELLENVSEILYKLDKPSLSNGEISLTIDEYNQSRAELCKFIESTNAADLIKARSGMSMVFSPKNDKNLTAITLSPNAKEGLVKNEDYFKKDKLNFLNGNFVYKGMTLLSEESENVTLVSADEKTGKLTVDACVNENSSLHDALLRHGEYSEILCASYVIKRESGDYDKILIPINEIFDNLIENKSKFSDLLDYSSYMSKIEQVFPAFCELAVYEELLDGLDIRKNVENIEQYLSRVLDILHNFQVIKNAIEVEIANLIEESPNLPNLPEMTEIEKVEFATELIWGDLHVKLGTVSDAIGSGIKLRYNYRNQHGRLIGKKEKVVELVRFEVGELTVSQTELSNLTFQVVAIIKDKDKNGEAEEYPVDPRQLSII